MKYRNISARIVKIENTIPATALLFLLFKPMIPKINDKTDKPPETKMPKPYIPIKRKNNIIERIDNNKLVKAII